MAKKPNSKEISEKLDLVKDVEFKGEKINKLLLSGKDGSYPFGLKIDESKSVQSLEDIVEFVEESPKKRFSVHVTEEGEVVLSSYSVLEIGLSQKTTKKLVEALKKD